MLMKQLLLSFNKWLPTATDPVATAYLPKRSTMMEYDQALVWVTMLLMLFGVVMVYSASISDTEVELYQRLNIYLPGVTVDASGCHRDSPFELEVKVIDAPRVPLRPIAG